MAKKLLYLFIVFLLAPPSLFAQDIELYQQFNGKYDYLAVGNTLNLAENAANTPCTIATQSSAQLTLTPQQTVVAAYLYWAGSGPGDFNIELNGIPLTAQRTFSMPYDATREFFGAFVDVTTYIQNTGNGNYTFSEMDLTNIIAPYCPNGLNFGGWSIIVVFEDISLPLNQINVYDGFEIVFAGSPNLDITIDNLNVIDNQGAKIGFLAWEGDSQLAVNETLRINGNILSNLPLNPANNAFNSTNTFTGSNQLWNMDIDVYNIENNIQIGDLTAQITLTSGQDLVIVNNIVTVLNSQLPDATIEIDNIIAGEDCGERDIFVEYTVYNLNSTDILPANTSIGFFADNTLIGTAATAQDIPIDGSESGSISLTVPVQIPLQFDLFLRVDYDNQVREIVETNNEDSTEIILLEFPVMVPFINQEKCVVVGEDTFDLTLSTIGIDPLYTVTYHTEQANAESSLNAISDPENFANTVNPQIIYVRVDNGDCFLIDTFTVEFINCPDATISIDNNLNACRQRELLIEYTVYNTNGTAPLPAQTPIAFYMENILVAQAVTSVVIPPGGEIQQSIYIDIGDTIPDIFELTLVVDDTGNGTGIVEEIDETNNTFTTIVTFGTIPEITGLYNMEKCNEGFGNAIFDLTLQNEFILMITEGEITYYTNYEDALAKVNAISVPHSYQSIANPQRIFIRLENEICFTMAEFLISTNDCPPDIPEGFSPNNDQINDFFEIKGLLNIFLHHELFIYTRKGNLIFRGNNETGHWNGNANRGLLYEGPVPAGVYYYVLYLNHSEYPKPYVGWVYLNK